MSTKEILQDFREKTFFKVLPENDTGNNEYKLKLVTENEHRLEQIAAQMRYRMNEGSGECVYTLGVLDDGSVIGLSEEEYKITKDNLEKIAKKNNYVISLFSKEKLNKDKFLYTFLIRENNPETYTEVKVACSGGVDHGKSSLIGVLLSGKQDNGRGSSRLSVFNFKHEIQSGRTSSISQHILGFSASGEVVNHQSTFGHKKTWPEIVKKSSKIVTLFDLCGHERYLKTTILGLTSQKPDLVFILVGGNMGISKMAREHMFLCLSLKIPFVFVVTKIDICQERKEVLKETVSSIKKLIKAPGIGKVPYDVQTEQDLLNAITNIKSMNVVPIFYVSSVSGEGIKNLLSFLNLFQPVEKKEKKEEKNIEYTIDQTFKVQGTGLVIGGQLSCGKIKVGDKLLLGPINNKYHNVQIKSIHCKRVPLAEIASHCYVCLGIKTDLQREEIRKGTVLISQDQVPLQVREFEADVMVLKTHTTTVKLNYEPVVHTGCIRQSAKILSIQNDKNEDVTILKTGDRARMKFQFVYFPEYLKTGARILLSEGMVKIIGKITSVKEENIDV